MNHGGAIDVHHHIAPPAWIAVVREGGAFGPWRSWSPERALEELDRNGVAAAVASVTTPGAWFGEPARARVLARACNEYAAQLAADHPGRWGNFATIPLPDVEGALAEIAYALDTLHADGIGLFTSYGDRWLGDPRLDPVFAELDRRGAVCFVHPSSPDCCKGILPFLRPSTIEYGTDTTRAIASYVFSGAAQRYPNVRLIFSHAGGTMPFLVERFPQQELDVRPPIDSLATVRRFFYDTAQTANAVPMTALRMVVPVSQIVFGSDYPYRTVGDHVEGLRRIGVFSQEELRAIERTNAASLLPRLPVEA